MENSRVARAFRQGALVVLLIAVFSLSLPAQSKLVSDYTSAGSPAPAPARDLNSSIAELLRVAPASVQDLTDLHTQGRFHWATFWRKDSAHSAQVNAALRRNLQFAVPNLVHDVQTSGGTVSSTFKLYNDLNLVCESLDSLISGPSHGNKAESTALANDLSDLNRIKEDLSSYIQQSAASLESSHPELVSSGGPPKKIIIDDNVPDKPKVKKHRPSNN
jgi:hypothetical protein